MHSIQVNNEIRSYASALRASNQLREKLFNHIASSSTPSWIGKFLRYKAYTVFTVTNLTPYSINVCDMAFEWTFGTRPLQYTTIHSPAIASLRLTVSSSPDCQLNINRWSERTSAVQFLFILRMVCVSRVSNTFVTNISKSKTIRPFQVLLNWNRVITSFHSGQFIFQLDL